MVETKDPFGEDDLFGGADVFGQPLGSIDLWEEEKFDDDGQEEFDWGVNPSNNNKGDKDNDDFTVATVSTRHSCSGHSRGSHPSVSSSSGSTISSHGSHFGSPKTCVIEALSASKHRGGIQRTRSHQQPKSSSSSATSSSDSSQKKDNNQDIQWDPNQSSSLISKRDRVKPRSVPRRGYSESSKDKPRQHRQERSNRPRLADGGKSSSQRKLSSKHKQSSPSSAERPRSSRQLFLEDDDKEHEAAVGDDTNKSKSSSSSAGGGSRRNIDRRAGLTRSHSSKMSRSNRKLGSLENSNPTISASTHANFQGPSSRRGQLGRSTSFKMNNGKKNRTLGSDPICKDERNEEDEDIATDNPSKPRSLQNLTRSASLGGSHLKPRRRTPTNGGGESSSQAAGGLPPTNPKLPRRPGRTTPSRSKSVSQ